MKIPQDLSRQFDQKVVYSTRIPMNIFRVSIGDIDRNKQTPWNAILKLFMLNLLQLVIVFLFCLSGLDITLRCTYLLMMRDSLNHHLNIDWPQTSEKQWLNRPIAMVLNICFIFIFVTLRIKQLCIELQQSMYDRPEVSFTGSETCSNTVLSKDCDWRTYVS